MPSQSTGRSWPVANRWATLFGSRGAAVAGFKGAEPNLCRVQPSNVVVDACTTMATSSPFFLSDRKCDTSASSMVKRAETYKFARSCPFKMYARVVTLSKWNDASV